MSDALVLERFSADLLDFGRHIPAPAKDAARNCLADALSCAAVGVATRAYERSAAVFTTVFGQPAQPGVTGVTGTAWFVPGSRSPLEAAYLNSLAVSAHDLDDGNRAATGHPGAAVIPVVLAEAEAGVGAEVDAETGVRASGAAEADTDLLSAIVVGYEAGVRLAAGRDQSHLHTMASGRWAGFAAAAASCWIRGDDAPTTAAALAHAGALAPQLAPPDGRRVDGLKEAIPWAATTGMIAARLARAGIPAPTYLIEAHPDYRAGGLSAIRPGSAPAILDTYFKRYACCRWIHPAIDALLALRSAEPIAPESVTALEVGTFHRSLTLGNNPHPRSLEEAHYSFPFCVALAMIDGADALLPIAESALNRLDVVALARRVTLTYDPAVEREFPAKTPAIVRVSTSAGLRELSVDTAQGDPSLAFPQAVLRAKHRRLLTAACSQAATRNLLRIVYEEPAPAVRPLIEALRVDEQQQVIA